MLTEEGREVLEAIHRQDRRNAAAMLSALDEPDKAVFIDALGKVARGVSGNARG